MTDFEVFKTLGQKPISPDNPAGLEARYDPGFLTLETEMSKLTSMTGAPPDWPLVVETASHILAESSKDLLAATYLGLGLLETGNFEGLEPTLTILSDLLENFWETCYPPLKRLKARQSAISWWREKTLNWLEKQTDTLEPGQSNVLIQAVKRLDQILGNLFPELQTLNDIIGQIQRLTPLDLSEPEDVSHPDEPEVAPQPATVTETTTINDIQSLTTALEAAATRYSSLMASPADPWLWKVSRLSVWLTLTDLPPAENQRILLEPPSSNLRNQLTAPFKAGQFLEAAMAAESQLQNWLLWLDLNYYVYTALTAAGSDYQLAARTVLEETTLLTDRFPELLDLTFNDGTPLAQEETKAWLKSRVADGFEADKLDRATEIENIWQTQGAPQALKALALARPNAENACDRMKLALVQLKILESQGPNEAICGLADRILAEANQRDLDTWSPPLARNLLIVIYRIYLKLRPQKTEDLEHLAARLSLLDPALYLSSLDTN